MATEKFELTEVRNDYTDDDNYTHIDGWKSEDEDEGGKTIAIVCRDTKKVFFIDNGYRNNPKVWEAINEILNQLDIV